MISMKRNLIAMTLLLSLGLGTPATAQTGQPAKAKTVELTDSSSQDEFVAYSDTTDTDDTLYDSTVVSSQHRIGGSVNGMSDFTGMLDKETILGLGLAITILVIIFIVGPVVTLIVLFYFINKNRRQKLKLAQMAVEKGQPIPEQVLTENAPEADDELWQKGMRQLFLGIGLMIFLYYSAGEIGLGIGALVACMGAGKLAIVKTSKKKEKNM